MSISLREIDFSYGELPVLAGVSAEARPGRVTALLGPNAAGKSTLLRCAIGAAAVGAGEALLDGIPSRRLHGRELARRLAYVPQRPTVAAAFTVREVVELGRFALGPAPGRVAAALADLELAHLGERPYPALSVGQQQRVALARAVAQLEPGAALVLDEPTAAMDLRHARACAGLLRRLAGEGCTVLVALHDLGRAAEIADDIWLLAAGPDGPPSRLVAAGPAGEVLEIERLRAVFGVEFEWVRRADGRRVLLADAAPASRTDGR